MMKKIFALLTIAISLSISAQESTLLRLNYAVGDQYLVSMNIKQGEMMDMNFDMNVDVKEVQDTVYNVEMGIKRVKMDINQNGTQILFDSDLSEEELDEVGKMMKAQFGPILTAKIFSKMTHRAETLEARAEPNLPGMGQFMNNTGVVVYPKEAVKVGDSWTAEKTENGMKMGFNYKVESIESSVVNVAITGFVSQIAEGTISGVMEIEKATGNVNSSNIDMHMNVSGNEMTMTINMVSQKL